MSQNDMSIANQGFAAFRSDLNSALQALASTSKGNSRPSTVYAGQLWVDDNTPSSTVWSLYFYDGTDDILLALIDTTDNVLTLRAGNGSASAPSFAFTNDTDCGMYRIGSNAVGLATAGVLRLYLDGNGNVGIGVTPSTVFEVRKSDAGSVDFFRAGISGQTNNPYLQSTCDEASGTVSLIFSGSNTPTAKIVHGGTDVVTIDTSSRIHFPAAGTTASAANAYLDNATTPANRLLRSTSSIAYKTDVKDMTDGEAAGVLALRPVTYRSKAENDDPKRRWYGLIAEEVAEVDPMLVHYRKEGKKLVPDGVQYDRLAVLLLHQVKALEARVAELEARLAV